MVCGFYISAYQLCSPLFIFILNLVGCSSRGVLVILTFRLFLFTRVGFVLDAACAWVASIRLYRVPEVPVQRPPKPVDDAERNSRRVHRRADADLGLAVLQLTGAKTQATTRVVARFGPKFVRLTGLPN